MMQPLHQLFRRLRFLALCRFDFYKGNSEYRWTYLEDGDVIRVVMQRQGGRGPARELRLRAGTYDLAVFSHIFHSLQYSTRDLARNDDLQARYEAIRAAGRRPLIIDAGANIGMAALYFRDIYPEAAILCVEPEPKNFAELQRHLRNDPLILPLQAAVASADGGIEIVDPGAGSNAFRTRLVSDGTDQRIPAYSFDSLLAKANTLGPVEPFLAKIDIEGFEAGLFDVNDAWIDRFYMIAIELHDWMLPKQGCSGSFLRNIAGRDRDFLLHGENIFSISNAAPMM
jgi:FkbM family methyltransferase